MVRVPQLRFCVVLFYGTSSSHNPLPIWRFLALVPCEIYFLVCVRLRSASLFRAFSFPPPRRFLAILSCVFLYVPIVPSQLLCLPSRTPKLVSSNLFPQKDFVHTHSPFLPTPPVVIINWYSSPTSKTPCFWPPVCPLFPLNCYCVVKIVCL